MSLMTIQPFWFPYQQTKLPCRSMRQYKDVMQRKKNSIFSVARVISSCIIPYLNITPSHLVIDMKFLVVSNADHSALPSVSVSDVHSSPGVLQRSSPNQDLLGIGAIAFNYISDVEVAVSLGLRSIPKPAPCNSTFFARNDKFGQHVFYLTDQHGCSSNSRSSTV